MLVLKGQRGITGLETAVILIAFVVVASIFAFTVLSTGLFSSERQGGKQVENAVEVSVSYDHVLFRDEVEGLVGKTVRDARLLLLSQVIIPQDAQSEVNGENVGEGYILQPGDRLFYFKEP